MRYFQVLEALVLLLIEFVNSHSEKIEICGRSHNLDSLIDNGKFVTVSLFVPVFFILLNVGLD